MHPTRFLHQCGIMPHTRDDPAYKARRFRVGKIKVCCVLHNGFGTDKAPIERQCRDPMGPQIVSKVCRKLVCSRFGQTIDRIAIEYIAQNEVLTMSPPSFPIMLGAAARLATNVERSPPIDHRIPSPKRLLPEWTRSGEIAAFDQIFIAWPGIVHENIDAAVLFDNLAYDGLGLSVVSVIALMHEKLAGQGICFFLQAPKRPSFRSRRCRVPPKPQRSLLRLLPRNVARTL